MPDLGLWVYQNDGGDGITARLVKALEAQGISVFSDFDMRQCHVIDGQVFTPSGQNLSALSVLYHMNADEQSAHQNDILHAIENSGVSVINTWGAFMAYRDKFFANQILRQNGICVPPSALLPSTLGTPPKIHEFLSFVADTLLSDAHRQNKDWVWFFATKTRDTILAQAFLVQGAALALGALPPALVATFPPHVLTDLSAFADWATAPPLAERDRANTIIEHFLRHIFAQNWAVTHPIHLYLGLPWQASPGLNISSYALLHAAYRLGESSEDLLLAATRALNLSPQSLPVLYLAYLLFDHNVQIRPSWARLLFPPMIVIIGLFKQQITPLFPSRIPHVRHHD